MDVHSIRQVNSFVNLQLSFILCQRVRYMQIETKLNQENVKLLQKSTLITTITVTRKVKIIL